jgi:hypothetical protein
MGVWLGSVHTNDLSWQLSVAVTENEAGAPEELVAGSVCEDGTCRTGGTVSTMV